MRILCVFFLLCCVSLTACARSVRVEVNSLADRAEGNPAGKNCLVLPGGEDAGRDDLQFREFAAQAAASLEQRGCRSVDRLEDADLAVLLSYGIGEPVIVEQRDYVIYRPWGRWSRGIPEYVPVVTTYVFNTGSIALEARKVEKGAPPSPNAAQGKKAESAVTVSIGRQLWKVSASHAGQQIDLRSLFPWLLTAAKDYYGVDSGQSVMVRVPAEALAPDAAAPPDARPRDK